MKYLKKLSETRRNGAVWCLILSIWLFLFWLLAHIVEDVPFLAYLYPLLVPEVVNESLHGWYSDFLPFLIFLISALLSALPLLGWFLLCRGKPLGNRLIRIPCILILLAVGLSMVVVVVGGFGFDWFVDNRFLWINLILSIVFPILLLKKHTAWDP